MPSVVCGRSWWIFLFQNIFMIKMKLHPIISCKDLPSIVKILYGYVDSIVASVFLLTLTNTESEANPNDNLMMREAILSTDMMRIQTNKIYLQSLMLS